LLLAASALLLVFPAAGCMESSHDAYINGLQIAGDADRRQCKLVFDESEKAHVLNSAKISDCLEANRKALAEFERARDKGLEGRELELTLEKTRDRISKLESMLRMVKKMEMDQKVER
jgi:hypothetical protein